MVESKFRGKFRYAIDVKGRVNIPSKFRRCITPAAQDTIVITRGTEGCLFAYPLDIWEQFEKLLESMPATQSNARFKRFLLDSFSDSVLDRQGRIMLSPEQMQLARIEKDVLIVGDIDKMQLWNPNIYAQEIEKALEGSSFDQYYYTAMDSLGKLKNGGD